MTSLFDIMQKPHYLQEDLSSALEKLRGQLENRDLTPDEVTEKVNVFPILLTSSSTGISNVETRRSAAHIMQKLVTRNEKNQKLCFESQAIPKIVSSLAVEEDSMIKELLLSTLSNTLNVEPARKQFVDLHFYNVLYGLLSQEQETPGIKVQASYSLSNLLKLPDSMGHLEHLDFVPLLLDIIRNDKSDSTMEACLSALGRIWLKKPDSGLDKLPLFNPKSYMIRIIRTRDLSILARARAAKCLQALMKNDVNLAILCYCCTGFADDMRLLRNQLTECNRIDVAYFKSLCDDILKYAESPTSHPKYCGLDGPLQAVRIDPLTLTSSASRTTF